jgi:Flp pilus assembly protein TadG
MSLRHRESEHGLALVEFALILPLLLALALGAVDLGRGLVSYVELEQAAQEGAIFGSFAPSDPVLIEDRVRTSADGLVPLADTAEVTVTVCSVASKIKVELRHEFQLFTPIVGELLGGSLSLRADAVGSNYTDPPEALPPVCA